MDYVRENCNNVSELSGKCHGISSGVFRGNPVSFPYILFYSYLFSLLSSGWAVIVVCDSISVQGPR